MDGLTLLDEARVAGLDVYENAGKLVVRGPDSLEPLARRLLAAKPQVLMALHLQILLGLRGPWGELDLQGCHEQIESAHQEILEFAYSRWREGAQGWSASMLAGFYVRDLLAGLELVLPWAGWSEVRDRLDRSTGPTTIARLWAAFTILPPATQAEVVARGDRSQSPPACLVVGADGPLAGGDR